VAQVAQVTDTSCAAAGFFEDGFDLITDSDQARRSVLGPLGLKLRDVGVEH